MNEPPGLPSALGIEAVEWLGQGTDSLTVRVRGRWRRRRPTWSGQPLLVIESGGVRHRFPAMPEPPSLTGAAPGTWQMSFTVPAAVSGPEGMRAWLQLGSVVVPLPVPVQSSAAERVPDEATLAQRRIRAAELAAEAAARRAADAEQEARELADYGERLQDELERLRTALAMRERALRRAEQQAHAERALREELEEQVDARETPGGEEERELRTTELEAELEDLRRALDEAEHVARAAVAARRRAEERAAELSRAPRGRADPDTLAAEFETHARAVRATSPAPGAAGVPQDFERIESERRLVARRVERAPAIAQLKALRAELEARVRTEAELRGELAALRGGRSAAATPGEPLRATLSELRTELAELRGALERESAGRESAEQRVALAYEAIQEVRDELEVIRGTAQPGRVEAPLAPTSSSALAPARSIEAERLAAALARLREQRPAPEDAPAEPPGESRWLWRALTVLARQDVALAARVIEAVAPGTPAEDAGRLARVLAGGALRRALRRGGARLRRRRLLLERLAALERSSVRFSQLRVEPGPALNLAASMIDPRWAEGERFTVAYNGGPYLNIRGLDRPLVSDAPIAEVSVSIVCPAQMLPAVLSGGRPPGTTIYGEPAPLELLREWLDRAQSG